MDRRYQKMVEEGGTAVEFNESDVKSQQLSFPASFIRSIVMSYLVSTCCCWALGGIAFILAIVGQKKAFDGNVTKARRLKIASYVISAIGLVTGVIILIFVIIHFVYTVEEAKDAYESNHQQNYP